MALRFTRGTPTDGTNEVQTLTFSGSIDGGTFKLSFRGRATASITWSATNSTLASNTQTALRALSTIDGANVTVAVGTMTSGIGTLTATFNGSLAKASLPTMHVAQNALTGSGALVAVSETTPGVDATKRSADQGDLLYDMTNGGLYMNTGGPGVAQWTAVPVAQSDHIADPVGAATDQDDEARAAIADILDALEAAGILAAS